jgi:DNA-directed RNA polymerase subunit RPC12/RpoP
VSVKNYFCAKCGRWVQNAYSPNLDGCPKGGRHRWTTFIRDGKTHYYRCKKCHTNKAELDHVPLVPNCREGGNHSWEKIK